MKSNFNVNNDQGVLFYLFSMLLKTFSWCINLPCLQLQPEDEQEKFDRLQMELLMNNPDSAAFYNAQMRTQRRVSDSH